MLLNFAVTYVTKAGLDCACQALIIVLLILNIECSSVGIINIDEA